eukprot:scaffold40683_cov39-Cyclotella_meneghiniana.AAC.3
MTRQLPQEKRRLPTCQLQSRQPHKQVPTTPALNRRLFAGTEHLHQPNRSRRSGLFWPHYAGRCWRALERNCVNESCGNKKRVLMDIHRAVQDS